MREQIDHHTGQLPLRVYRVSGVPCHWHDEMEFILPIDAPCECLIDAKPVTITVGEALLIHGRQMHAIRCQRKFQAIVFHPIGMCGPDMLPFFPPDRQFQVRLTREDSDILDTLHAICQTPLTYGYELRLRSHILSIFSRLLERGHYETATNSHPFLRVLTYAQNHACDPDLSLIRVAKATFFSPSSVSHNFRRYTGMTFSEFVLDFRLTKACELLRSTNRSVLEIALDCGFGHVSYFIKCFKRKFGATPHQYRA